MKQFPVLLLLLIGSISLHASSDDLSISKGTDQAVIVQLSPMVAQTDVWNNAKIEVSFNVPLDASSVQKNNIKLVHLSSKTNDHIDGTIEYDQYSNKVVYTPSALLSEGIYEVEIKSLKADKAYKTTQIKEIKYRFYVPEVINGHQLPPEPDPVVNDSTLLGIDANGNGVRDDVERRIYLQFQRPIEQAYLMQYATRYPKILKDPITAANSEELQQEQWNQYSCEGFLYEHINIQIPKDIVIFMENAYFDTEERMHAYIRFNEAMSGGSYGIPFHDRDMKEENCDFNVTKMLEME